MVSWGRGAGVGSGSGLNSHDEDGASCVSVLITCGGHRSRPVLLLQGRFHFKMSWRTMSGNFCCWSGFGGASVQLPDGPLPEVSPAEMSVPQVFSLSLEQIHLTSDRFGGVIPPRGRRGRHVAPFKVKHGHLR